MGKALSGLSGMAQAMELVARASITVRARLEEVWQALVDPQAIKQYMFGTEAVSEWTEGAPIRWRGEWQGQRYEDHGTILRMDAPRRLEYTHFSPLAGVPDMPENHHTITIELVEGEEDETVRVVLEQDNNASEEALLHSEANWRTMLEALRSYVEGNATK